MNEETHKLLYEGVVLGTRRYVARLMENFLSDPDTSENFERGLERAAEVYTEAVALLDKLLLDARSVA